MGGRQGCGPDVAETVPLPSSYGDFEGSGGRLECSQTPRAASISLNSPRAGRQQGQAGSERVHGGSFPVGTVVKETA